MFQDDGISQRIDSAPVSKIETYVKEVVTDTREMKRLLKIIVKTKIFKGADIPEQSNQRFFP